MSTFSGYDMELAPPEPIVPAVAPGSRSSAFSLATLLGEEGHRAFLATLAELATPGGRSGALRSALGERHRWVAREDGRGYRLDLAREGLSPELAALGVATCAVEVRVVGAVARVETSWGQVVGTADADRVAAAVSALATRKVNEVLALTVAREMHARLERRLEEQARIDVQVSQEFQVKAFADVRMDVLL